jgi:hypothetical protein
MMWIKGLVYGATFAFGAALMPNGLVAGLTLCLFAGLAMGRLLVHAERGEQS